MQITILQESYSWWKGTIMNFIHFLQHASKGSPSMEAYRLLNLCTCWKGNGCGVSAADSGGTVYVTDVWFPFRRPLFGYSIKCFLKVCLKLTEQKNAGILLPQVLVRSVSCQDLWAGTVSQAPFLVLSKKPDIKKVQVWIESQIVTTFFLLLFPSVDLVSSLGAFTWWWCFLRLERHRMSVALPRTKVMCMCVLFSVYTWVCFAWEGSRGDHGGRKSPKPWVPIFFNVGSKNLGPWGHE